MADFVPNGKPALTTRRWRVYVEEDIGADALTREHVCVAPTVTEAVALAVAGVPPENVLSVEVERA